MDFCLEVKRLCKLNGLTIDGVIREAMNLDSEARSHSSFQNWKRSGIYPRGDVMYKIAKQLGVTVEHFFEDEAHVDAVNTRQQHFVELMSKLNDNQLAQVESLIEAFTKN